MMRSRSAGVHGARGPAGRRSHPSGVTFFAGGASGALSALGGPPVLRARHRRVHRRQLHRHSHAQREREFAGAGHGQVAFTREVGSLGCFPLPRMVRDLQAMGVPFDQYCRRGVGNAPLWDDLPQKMWMSPDQVERFKD